MRLRKETGDFSIEVTFVYGAPGDAPEFSIKSPLPKNLTAEDLLGYVITTLHVEQSTGTVISKDHQSISYAGEGYSNTGEKMIMFQYMLQPGSQTILQYNPKTGEIIKQ